MPGPLSNLRVIDLSSGPAGGLATMVLGDFGADVLKVEPPGGDPTRELPHAPLWLRGKRSMVLDLEASRDQERLHDLARTADVVVASWAPGGAEALGADYATLASINPGLIYCSITGWGPVGEYAGYPVSERLVAAKSGRMLSFRGQPPREGPAFAAVQVGTHAASQAAVQGIIAGLLARERDGRGQLVETSLLQGMLPYDMGGLLRIQIVERDPTALGPDPLDDLGRMPTLNYTPVLAADGRWIQPGNLLDHLFYSFITAADLTELIVGEQFQGDVSTWPADVREQGRDIILQRMREGPADEWMRIFLENGNVAAELFQTTQQGLTHPDVVANGGSVECEHPRLGRVRQLGLVARLEETPGEVGGAHPEVGEHTREVLAQGAPPQPAPEQMPQPAAASSEAQLAGPLAGVTVLEFATIIAAPYAASILGDLGARVIKVEPMGGDPSRGRGADGIGLNSSKLNASKESIYVDLKTPEGQEIISRLLPQADVILHNYRPGVPERLGIGYEQARGANPQVVWVSANGYGPDGPGARRPGAHPIPGAAMGGALYQAGEGMPPSECATVEEMREAARFLMRANEVNPDPNTSLVIATGVMLGLYAARRLGTGQRIFVDMLNANLYANFDDALSYEGKPPRRTVDRDVYGLSALERLYETRAGWVYLEAASDAAWGSFCRAVERADLLEDARFATSEGRANHDGELARALSDLFLADDAEAWERLLIPAGVGCVRADAATPGAFWAHDPHVQENGFAVTRDHGRFGRHQRHGTLVTMRGTPLRPGPGVLGGADTDRILTELGYDTDTIAHLRESRVVGSEAP